MIVQNLYRYMGTNGILDSSVELPGVPHILRYRLLAAEGHVLQNAAGYTAVAIDVNTEAEIANWSEIPMKGQE